QPYQRRWRRLRRIQHAPTNPMGYIQELEAELTAMLADLGEAEQRQVVRYVKEKILESYKNGIMSAKLVDANKEASKQSRRLSREK
ncbi:MAG: hypothetical protein AB7P69_18885, partial [Candidatus Binatia bacterium]